jgi:hypothetical protein
VTNNDRDEADNYATNRGSYLMHSAGLGYGDSVPVNFGLVAGVGA